MKRRQVTFIGLLIAAGLALCIGAVATQRITDDEREVSLGEMPDAVTATILAQAQGNTINEIEVEMANGQAVYEAEVIVNGREVDIRVAADGTLLAQEADDEEGDDENEEADDDNEEDEEEVQVALADVPDVVRATIVKEAAGAEIKEIEKETEDGRTIYSAEAIINGQEVDLEIAPDGTLLGKEMENADEND
jgi:uncharacterized membrane protein YkoI